MKKTKDIESILTAFENCDEDTKAVASGLVERVVFLNKQLNDIEKDIEKNGLMETVYKANMAEPIQQQRSIVGTHCQLMRNYTPAVAKLQAMVEKAKNNSSHEDEFMKFINSGE